MTKNCSIYNLLQDIFLWRKYDSIKYNHVEYLPQNNEIKIFENLKKNITIKKDIYDELEFIKLIENTRDYDTDDSYTMEDLEIDFNI